MDEVNLKSFLESPLIQKYENGLEFGGEPPKRRVEASEAIGELKKQMKLVGSLVVASFSQYSL